MIFTQLIRANLQTRTLGNQIEYYTRLESTNSAAQELIDDGVAFEGTVVVADQQTAGKGRRNRSWFSAPGKGLTFSVILAPNIPARKSGLIPIMAGISVAESLENFQLAPQLKWPNDILISGRKCGGILAESTIQGQNMVSVVVGIGINTNETAGDFPEELRPMATSLAIEKGSPVQRELVLAWILNSLEVWSNRLKAGETPRIREAWLKRCPHAGKEVTFDLEGRKRSGTFAGITEWGEGVVTTTEGDLHLSSEEISLL